MKLPVIDSTLDPHSFVDYLVQIDTNELLSESNLHCII